MFIIFCSLASGYGLFMSRRWALIFFTLLNLVWAGVSLNTLIGSNVFRNSVLFQDILDIMFFVGLPIATVLVFWILRKRIFDYGNKRNSKCEPF